MIQKFKPILFSTQMVQAILEGAKTQTRRIMKPQPPDCSILHMQALEECQWRNEKMRLVPKKDKSGKWYCEFCGNGINPDGRSTIKAKYEAGDILWVRETWTCLAHLNPDNTEYEYFYKADGVDATLDGLIKWKPSIFMPKEACRLFLKVTDVRAERLQDISEGDAVSEGVESLGLYPGYSISSIGKFEGLWNLINSKWSWEENPFVWVISFERIDKPENFK